MASYDYWAVGEDPNHLESEPRNELLPGAVSRLPLRGVGAQVDFSHECLTRYVKDLHPRSSSKRLEAMKNDENRCKSLSFERYNNGHARAGLRLMSPAPKVFLSLF